ncbi:MAG TPA: Holliday junction resolvase RuvX [Thermodesulfobacteriota bacterium]|nr:Holliday junction resolvase RuvX [Thermodesulfobacteriota bacterium]
MRILALDVGTKTIGVAVSDELGIAAHGVTTIKRTELKRDLETLRKIIDEYNPSEILVGIPYNSDGTVSKRGKEILKFAEKLKKTFPIPVEFWDESFSTVRAEEVLLEADLSRRKRKKVIDKIAAVFILEDYLRAKANVQPRIDTNGHEL